MEANRKRSAEPKVSPPTLQRKMLIDHEEGIASAHGIDHGREETAVRHVVTPAKRSARATDETPIRPVRRELFPSSTSLVRPVPITPSRRHRDDDEEDTAPAAKRRLRFGRLVTEIEVSENVRHVYKIIRKLTGAIGGNACHGPIYGELTQGSMQKVVNLMKEHAKLNAKSRFIDVGSGIGKPNLHVAQDPGVELSYGIEIEKDRWILGMSCLKAILEAALAQQSDLSIGSSRSGALGYRCTFDHGDIRLAKSFDPFTHVYMFSIGFPPALWIDLAEIWNRSTSPYLICFHGPKVLLVDYEFQLEVVAQAKTSMHGSKEGHTAYIYRRVPFNPDAVNSDLSCDELFKNAHNNNMRHDLETRFKAVDARLREEIDAAPSRRIKRSQVK